jgi:succinate dehydrogenase flavin-adding protein (antitoxin of CptAB toxin-antitoxin module)
MLRRTIRAAVSVSHSACVTASPIACTTTKFSTATAASSTGAGVSVDVAAAKVQRRDADLRATYDAVLDTYPAHAQPDDGTATVDKYEAYKKRLLYRSKQRGWYVSRVDLGVWGVLTSRATFGRCTRLEVDLLMGSFATKFLPTMTLDEMKAYERILSCETVDLFHYLSGQSPVPAVCSAVHLRDSVVCKWPSSCSTCRR